MNGCSESRLAVSRSVLGRRCDWSLLVFCCQRAGFWNGSLLQALLNFGEKYLEDQCVLGNQWLWAWLIYRCNLRSWFSIWWPGCVFTESVQEASLPGGHFLWPLLCQSKSCRSLMSKHIIMSRRGWAWYKVSNGQLTKIYSLSLRYFLSLSFSIISPWNEAGCVLPAFLVLASEQDFETGRLMFRLLAAGPSGSVKWTHLEHLTKGSERENAGERMCFLKHSGLCLLHIYLVEPHSSRAANCPLAAATPFGLPSILS